MIVKKQAVRETGAGSGYVFTLGKQSIELEEFAEEVRELNIYTRYLPFQPEGEVAAKIHIPSVRLERVEKYACSDAIKALDQNTLPPAAVTSRQVV